MDREGYICSQCLGRLPFVDQSCSCARCPRELAGTERRVLCGECGSIHPPHFDCAISAMHFEDEARDLILSYKYHSHLHLAPDLATFMFAVAGIRYDISQIDVVVPMCSSFLHRLLRGYNQCDYLAKFLAQKIGVPCACKVLARKGFPRRQAGLKAEDRWKNAENSFRCRNPEPIENKTVLLIDDVFTTGATLSYAAKALKLAGAKRVWCVTIAKA